MDQKAQEILARIMEEEKKQGITEKISDEDEDVGIVGRFEQAMYKLSDIDPQDFLDAMSDIINAGQEEEGEEKKEEEEDAPIQADATEEKSSKIIDIDKNKS